MVDIEFIRKKHFIEGWSIRKIAKNLGTSRQSVRKALASSELPRYKLTVPRPRPVMDPYKDLIMSWLEADKKAPPKQRHTAKRIYDRLVEKGAAENLVGYMRRNALVPVRDYADFDAPNAHLLGWSEKERSRLWDEWLKEREGLRPLAERPHPCSITTLAAVSKTSLIAFDRNRYSVPSKWANRTVQVVVTWDRVKVVVGDEVVAEHQRLHSRGETVIELEHYLPVLALKPRASMNALAVRRLGGVWEKTRVLFSAQKDGYREFTRILMLNRDYPPEEVTSALQTALAMGRPARLL